MVSSELSAIAPACAAAVAAAAAPDAEQILALRQEAALLREALTNLSSEQRKTIQKAFVEDLPYSQISQMTGLPLGTVKSRIRLGLDRLRHELRGLNR